MIFLAIGSQETAYPTYLEIKYKALFQNPTLGVFLEFLNPAGSLKSGAFFRLGRFFAQLGGLGGLGGPGSPDTGPGGSLFFYSFIYTVRITTLYIIPHTYMNFYS